MPSSTLSTPSPNTQPTIPRKLEPNALISTNHPPSPFSLILYSLPQSSTVSSHAASNSPNDDNNDTQPEEIIFRIAPQHLWDRMHRYYSFALPDINNLDMDTDTDTDEAGDGDGGGNEEDDGGVNKAAAAAGGKFSVHDKVLVPYTHRCYTSWKGGSSVVDYDDDEGGKLALGADSSSLRGTEDAREVNGKKTKWPEARIAVPRGQLERQNKKKEGGGGKNHRGKGTCKIFNLLTVNTLL